MADSITPIIIDGQPTCPPGYALSPDKTQCLPISPPIKIDAYGLKDTEVDPVAYAKKLAEGFRTSGFLERIIVAALSGLSSVAAPLIAFAASLFDSFLAALAGFFFSAQGQRNLGYFLLVGELMTDLTGIKVDGEELFNEFSAHGRVAAMGALGASLFRALASEFVGETQADAGNAWKISPGAGVGGLPVHTYQPGEGVKAAHAFLGFATSFAVREGNTDMLADFLPYGLGHWFKDFGEDFSKALGLSRLLRVALRPLMQIMVAEPLTADLNSQYRPKLLGVSETLAARAWGAYSDDQVKSELAMLGYSDARQDALAAQGETALSIGDAVTLRAAKIFGDAEFDQEIQLHSFGAERAALLRTAHDLAPARRLSLAYLDHYVTQYLTGHLTQASITSFLDGIEAGEHFLVTSGEVEAVRNLTRVIVAPFARPRHLSVAQLQQAYIDGTITLDEFEQHITALGYLPADITVIVLETLIKAKQHAAAAAKKAASGKTGTPTPASTFNPGASGAPGAAPQS